MLIDQLGRDINYLRVSLTDRCNYRCTYCMPENMEFSPRSEALSVDEMTMICTAFVELGVKKIRLTGGEPTIHPDFDDLLGRLDAISGLDAIAVTTNGSMLQEKALQIASKKKVQQLNISLDSVDEDNFKRITRTGNLHEVVAGIDAAKAAGIKRLRLNVVVSAGVNTHEMIDLLAFAIEKECHIAFIEEMPLGNMSDYSRSEHFLSNDDVLQLLQTRYSLLPLISRLKQAGPASYYKVENSVTEVGFISPHSNNFCDQCNRVRLTRKGELILCLGQEQAIDLRAVMMDAQNNNQDVLAVMKLAIVEAMAHKPDSHQFDTQDDDVQVVRFMNVTGG
ncbi:MAG: GTP 3',8-cyclase MoaA [Sinobacterium sp.]|nr:GTP 3',8-cyclase MoaA [Sinobacterium sp.]